MPHIMGLSLNQVEKELLQAALYEYIDFRGPTVEEYVNRRYPMSDGYTADFLAGKLKRVESNLDIARSLRDRLFE